MLKAKNEWLIRPVDEKKAKKLSTDLRIPVPVARLLVQRGFEDTEAAQRFLHIQKENRHDPMLLDGMTIIKERVLHAIENKEKILIFGDYDADGVSSTSLMVRALHDHGADVTYYVPDRFKEGYGPNIPALQKAKESGIDLVITVDTGISAVDEAAFAKGIGLDYIVTDHHEPPPVLPDALAIINPKKPGCPYPFKSLAGAGVALKVIQALFDTLNEDYIAIAAIGTIADLVPLVDENRWIAAIGLSQLKKSTIPGIQALIQASAIDAAALNEESVGFAIGPRINAAGRMTHASEAIELFLTEEIDVALRVAQSLDKLNQERKATVEEITTAAMEQARKLIEQDNKVLVVYGEEWHEGVIGIVASRLVERFYRPTIVLSLNKTSGMAKGSARSIEGFDIFQALSTCREFLPHFGGHPMAAGMSLAEEDVPLLQSRLNGWALENVDSEVFQPKLSVDLACRAEEITLDMIETLEQMAPFGTGNPKPLVVVEETVLAEARQIGKNKDHLKLNLKDRDTVLDGIAFQMGHLSHEMTKQAQVRLVGEVSINEWNGYRKPQILVRDIKIDEWQLFDWRNERHSEEAIHRLPEEKTIVIAFNDEYLENEKVDAALAADLEASDLAGKYAVFLDTPENPADLTRLLNKETFPERVYAIFKSGFSDYFSPIPTREHFKKVYAFFKKYQPLQINMTERKLAGLLGIQPSNIKFIIEVFFDLNFVTMENGLLSIAPDPNKQDLTTAKPYKKRLARIEVEDLLCYSSYAALKQWICDKIEEPMKAKEATIQ